MKTQRSLIMIWQIMGHRPNGPNGVETLNSSWVFCSSALPLFSGPKNFVEWRPKREKRGKKEEKERKRKEEREERRKEERKERKRNVRDFLLCLGLPQKWLNFGLWGRFFVILSVKTYYQFFLVQFQAHKSRLVFSKILNFRSSDIHINAEEYFGASWYWCIQNSRLNGKMAPKSWNIVYSISYPWIT